MLARRFCRDTISSACFMSAIIYGKKHFYPQKFDGSSENIVTKEQIKEKYRKDIDRCEVKIMEMSDKLNVKNLEIYYDLNIGREASMSRLKDKNVLCINLAYALSDQHLKETIRRIKKYNRGMKLDPSHIRATENSIDLTEEHTNNLKNSNKHLDFVVGHELGHASNKCEKYATPIFIAINSMGVGFISYVKISRVPFVVCITIIASFLSKVIYKRYCEKQADLTSARLGNAESGIKFFMQEREHQAACELKTLSVLGIYVDRNSVEYFGDNVADIYHPFFSTRIKYLEKYQNENRK